VNGPGTHILPVSHGSRPVSGETSGNNTAESDWKQPEGGGARSHRLRMSHTSATRIKEKRAKQTPGTRCRSSSRVASTDQLRMIGSTTSIIFGVHAPSARKSRKGKAKRRYSHPAHDHNKRLPMSDNIFSSRLEKFLKVNEGRWFQEN
jgi:hypothetical protein